MRRWLYWLGVLVAVALLATGTTLAWQGYAATAGPDGVVRGYFAALARGDASDALAFGALPDGPHTMLTGTVLEAQQRIAPIRHVSVGHVARHGATAAVPVRYVLAFPGKPIPVDVTVHLHRHGGDWRLDQVAVPTELDVGAAAQRMTVVGAGVPSGPTLLFPGALPIGFDTPYLALDPQQDTVTFGAPPTVTVAAVPTPAAQTALLAQTRRMLQTCVTGSPDVACPLPDERYVPGSLHGTLAGSLQNAVVRVDPSDRAGTLDVSAEAAVHGSYRKLGFDNVATAGTGTVTAEIHAAAYAVPPLRLHWTAP